MQVGIDCSCIAKPERTGVARYCVSLLHALTESLGANDRVVMLYRVSRVRHRQWFEQVDDARFSRAVFHDGIGPFPRHRMDVVHGPDLRVPVLGGLPGVSTIHDLSALDVPGIARESFKERKRRALADVAERAAAIVCISEFTRDSFLARFPGAEERTRVIPLGLAGRFVPAPPDDVDEIRRRLGIRAPYALFVGQVSARKNLGPLLEAFAALRAEPATADLELVLAGPVQTGGDEIVARIEASGHAAAVHLIGFVGDDALPALYSGAAVFCFTGKAEGFGLPILEAMACGCPVVAADAAASGSTAGGAALLVPPDDAGALTDTLRGVLTDGALRADLMRRGAARAALFDWRRTADATVAVYRDAIAAGVPV